MAELRYYAGACPECSRRGKPRYNAGGQKTETLHCVQGFTGQRAGAQQNDLGMYWYNSRWYDQLTGRFLQRGTLLRLCPGWIWKQVQLYVELAQAKRKPRRVQLFLQALSDALTPNRTDGTIPLWQRLRRPG